LNSLVGPGTTLISDAGQVAQPATRTDDVAPFSGGDQINGSNGLTCTGGFTVIGNASGNPFMLSAGHCGSANWKVAPAGGAIGTTSKLYIRNTDEDDFQTIPMSAGDPNVWIGANTLPVVGQ
jgi:hypothetical protein